jgi:hypothetical protein
VSVWPEFRGPGLLGVRQAEELHCSSPAPTHSSYAQKLAEIMPGGPSGDSTLRAAFDQTAGSKNSSPAERALRPAPRDWGKLLGDVAAVRAMLDCLLHHGHVLKCGPRSWRTKPASASGQ